MPTVAIADNPLDGLLQLRNEPVQARSTARLTALLDAAAAIIDEIGFERLTTAMVAERAGASIGTVYRYFPDRIAVLQALAARNLERVLDRVVAEVRRPGHDDWLTALSAGFGIFVEAFRTEPGFRSLRLGDVLDLRSGADRALVQLRRRRHVMDALVARFRSWTPRVPASCSRSRSRSPTPWPPARSQHDPNGDERSSTRAATRSTPLLKDEFAGTAPKP